MPEGIIAQLPHAILLSCITHERPFSRRSVDREERRSRTTTGWLEWCINWKHDGNLEQLLLTPSVTCFRHRLRCYVLSFSISSESDLIARTFQGIRMPNDAQNMYHLFIQCGLRNFILPPSQNHCF